MLTVLPESPTPRTETEVEELWRGRGRATLRGVIVLRQTTRKAATERLELQCPMPGTGTFRVVARLGNIVGGVLFGVEFDLRPDEYRHRLDEYLLRGDPFRDVLEQLLVADFREKGFHVEIVDRPGQLTFPARMRLQWVEGDDASEHHDLIGTVGEVEEVGSRRKHRFKPDGRGDWIVLETAFAAASAGRVHLWTRLGNCFVFRPIPAKKEPA